MSISKQTAALLYGHSYQLQNLQQETFDIFSVDGCKFYTYSNMDNTPVEFDINALGELYFIRCRPLSSLTKPMENGEVPIFKMFNQEYKGTSHVEDVREMYFTEGGRFITASHYGTAAETSFNVLFPECNNNWKISFVHDLHFKPSALTNEMCVWID